MMTILIFFQTSDFKCFKNFYQFLRISHIREFPNLVSYNRFTELEEICVMPSMVLLSGISGQCDGQSFIDSTALSVCHIKRELSHKTFFGLAKKSKSTMGWFFGFKLHLIINSYVQVISFSLTNANVDDRKSTRQFIQ